MPYKTVLLMPNEEKDEDFRLTRRLCLFLRARGCRVFAPEAVCRAVKDSALRPLREADLETVELVLPLGGDGTILASLRKLRYRSIPFLGINLGHLGFLAEVEPGGAEEALTRVLSGDFHIERRILLSGAVVRKDGTAIPRATQPAESRRAETIPQAAVPRMGTVPQRTAVPQPETVSFTGFNDVVISRQTRSPMPNLGVYINEQYIDSYLADGLIVCTPTGSTAYNLSAGGPILAPTAQNLVITPICPHSLNVRSIVVSENDWITIHIGVGKNECERAEPVLMSVDGQEYYQLFSGDSVRVKRAEETVQIVKIHENTFYQTLKKKLF